MTCVFLVIAMKATYQTSFKNTNCLFILLYKIHLAPPSIVQLYYGYGSYISYRCTLFNVM